MPVDKAFLSPFKPLKARACNRAAAVVSLVGTDPGAPTPHPHNFSGPFGLVSVWFRGHLAIAADDTSDFRAQWA